MLNYHNLIYGIVFKLTSVCTNKPCNDNYFNNFVFFNGGTSRNLSLPIEQIILQYKYTICKQNATTILRTMIRFIFLNSILFIFLMFSTAVGQVKLYEIDSLVVTATRLEHKFSATRSVSTVSQPDIFLFPVQSAAHLMGYGFGVSISSRGAPGVQADLSLRGAGFEQVLVLLDGVRMNDPQTGHHNTNLPVSLNSIERIEVLRGQSSVLYGPDAFGGVINIITKSASPEKTFFTVRAGSFHTTNLAFTTTIPKNTFTNRFSFETSRSNGYTDKSGWNISPSVIPNTDYKINTLNWKTAYTGAKLNLTAESGILEKSFGAYNFYVSNGSEFERIQSAFSAINCSYEHSPSFTTTYSIHFKQHRDHYTLSRYRPALYTADHITERFGAEWTGRIQTADAGSLVFGVEGIQESIRSNRLGNWITERFAAFSEYGNTFKNDILLDFGARLDNHSVWGTEFNPSIGIGYVVTPHLLVKSSFGRSFRAPTFIELYNPSISKNIGNPALKPETAVTLDFGTDYSWGNKLKGSTTYYFRNQKRTIDWISTDSQTFQVVNIFTMHSWGVEQNIQLHCSGTELRMPAISSAGLRISYIYLNQDKKPQGIVSRYVFTQPQHYLTLAPAITVKQLNLSAGTNYKNYPGFNTFLTLDSKISYIVGSFQFAIDGFNLTDTHYQEIRNVPMTGRALYFSITYSR